MGLFQQLFPNGDRSVLDLIPIVDYKDNCFLLESGEVFDIMQFTTRDFTSVSDDDIEYDNMTLVKFLRLYADDFKIVSLSFPTDTREQQQYLQHKISTNKNAVFNYYLNYKLEELHFIATHRTDFEFYLFVWAKNKEDLKDKYIIVQRSLGSDGLIAELDEEKKYQILFKLTNKNASISN